VQRGGTEQKQALILRRIPDDKLLKMQNLFFHDSERAGIAALSFNLRAIKQNSRAKYPAVQLDSAVSFAPISPAPPKTAP
jgi:hypothetical protein